MQESKGQISFFQVGYTTEVYMGFDEFEQLVCMKKTEKPFWFQGEGEPISSEADVLRVEKILKMKLPNEYRFFIKNYGGGYFGLTNVFVASDSDEWGVVRKKYGIGLSDDFLVVSEDEAGGYYGFIRQGGEFSNAVYYFYPDCDDAPKKKYPSFLEYLVKVGLQQ